jgi:hypothetical protein
MKILQTHKVYVVKKQNGCPLMMQRGYSSEDRGVAVYKTWSGAERAALPIEGGVFSVYVQSTEDRKTTDFRGESFDTYLSRELAQLGFNCSQLIF